MGHEPETGLLEVAGASVIGTSHLAARRNGQDAFAWRQGDGLLAAAVCDGCGSAAHSEVGAQLGARLAVEAMHRLFAGGIGPEDERFAALVGEAMLRELGAIARALGGQPERTVADSLLFTVIGLAITGSHTLVFAAGDGVVVVNGQLRELGPFAGNAPPYLAYGLLPELAPVALERLVLLPTQALDSLAIATDGLAGFEALASRTLPGRTDRVGSLTELWNDPACFTNPDGLRRRLARLNREATKVDWNARVLTREPGLLSDDATLVVVRRRPRSAS